MTSRELESVRGTRVSPVESGRSGAWPLELRCRARRVGLRPHELQHVLRPGVLPGPDVVDRQRQGRPAVGEPAAGTPIPPARRISRVLPFSP
jgi:hypothetical protein